MRWLRSGSTRTGWRRNQRALTIRRTAATGATTDKPTIVPRLRMRTRCYWVRGGNDGKRAIQQGASIDGCVLAGGQLPVGRSDLPLRQPDAQAIAHKGSHKAA